MFRFTIRDVLWLMVVVGLACGWYIYRLRQGETMSKLKTDWQMQRAVDSIE